MFRKIACLMMAAVMIFSLSACGKARPEDGEISVSIEETPGGQVPDGQEKDAQEPGTSLDETEAAQQEQTASGTGNTLVVYFSWSGNTEEMASYLAEQAGGDLLEIEPAVPYPEDYSECGDVAKNERDEDERPAIENLPESLEQYDTILVGYPIWWHTVPMIIGTFLESYDLTGTDIYPFSQSASMDTEQFENSMDFVRESAGNANVHEGLFAEPSDTEAIDRYLTENGLIQ